MKALAIARVSACLLAGCTALASCSGGQASPSAEVPLCATLDSGAMVECTGCALPSSTWAASGTLACAHPIAAYCDQTQTPIPAWVAPGCPPATWVELLASERATGWPPLYEECDTFDVAYAGWSCGGNSVVTFFYDKASGNLTAAVQFDGAGHPGEQTCLAGPASFDAASLRAAGCVPHQCFPADAGLQSPSCDLDASSGD